MLQKILGFLFVVGCVQSCSTTREIVINSTPDQADVFIKEVGAENFEKIGKTPITLGDDIIKKVLNNEHTPVVIEVTRVGYETKQLIVNDLGKTNIKYDFNLNAKNVDTIISKIDNVGSELFEAQRLMRAGGYDGSMKILDKLMEEYPYSSLINELKGAVYYLKRDYKNSLIYYDMACKYNIKNADALKMKKYLEDQLGVKRPLASDKGTIK